MVRYSIVRLEKEKKLGYIKVRLTVIRLNSKG